MIAQSCIRSARLLTFALLLNLLLAAPGVLAQSASFARTDYPLLGNDQTVADFNGDGRLDLAGTGGDFVGVMLGNGDGTFRPKVLYPAGGPSQDLAAGDFNGDGRLDLVVTINDPQTGLALLAGRGDGTFGPPETSPNTTGLDSPAVVATDLDNDGALDVVVTHFIACYTAPCQTGMTISLHFGHGDGTFEFSREVVVGTGMSEIAVGDYNRDGLKDLAISGDSSQVYVLIGQGNGTFAQQPTIRLTADTLGVDGTDIDAADLNGDSILDLVVAIGLNGSRTAILIGHGDGSFRAPQIITEPNLRIPLYQSIADYNGDGRLDLAIGLGWGVEGLLEILHGNGDGTFQAPRLYLAPADRSSVSGGRISAGDFNNDGRPDLALQVTGAAPGLAALRNSTGVASAALAYGSVNVSPSSVAGGATAQGEISLAPGAVAPAGGLQFSLSSSNTSAATVPASVTMPAGSSSVQFNVNTRSVSSSRSVTLRVSNNRLGSRSLSLTVTPSQPTPTPTPTPTPRPTPTPIPTPTPVPVSLSSLTLTPASLTGGATAQGTVTLSARAPAATTVTLSSSSASAGVPASVTVPAGASTATFSIGTANVNSTTSATIGATLNGVTRTATLTINPATANVDRVSITRVEYDSGKRSLRVEATSSSSSATLRVYNTSTGALLGTLSNRGGGQYGGQLNVSSNPQSITVRSSLGGVATRTVSGR